MYARGRHSVLRQKSCKLDVSSNAALLMMVHRSDGWQCTATHGVQTVNTGVWQTYRPKDHSYEQPQNPLAGYQSTLVSISALCASMLKRLGYSVKYSRGNEKVPGAVWSGVMMFGALVNMDPLKGVGTAPFCSALRTFLGYRAGSVGTWLGAMFTVPATTAAASAGKEAT